jgi:LmbE family N-acetylglucosaminyl deacetylase
MSATLFLLAHPDDDVFMRPLIARASQHGGLIAAYLTRARTVGAGVRAKESLRALNSLGIDERSVLFVGDAADVENGKSFLALDKLHAKLLAALGGGPSISAIVTHAWEGGHPDHDAAHLLGLRLSREWGIAENSLGVACYRSDANGLLPFIVQYPPPGSPGFYRERISIAEAAGMALSIRHYKSQWRTFMGLGPWIVLRALFDRSLWAQPLSQSTAPARPYAKALLSEVRFKVPFARIEDAASAFLNAANARD